MKTIISSVREPIGGVGRTLARLGGGIAAVLCFRTRDQRLARAAVLSLLALGFRAAGKVGIGRLLAIGHFCPRLPEPVR
jgi:hypothetical protein